MKGWYVEVYDENGVRTLAEDDHTFTSVKQLVIERNRQGRGTVRFVAPNNVPSSEIDLLKSLGAVRT